jgi:hypothetical protein
MMAALFERQQVFPRDPGNKSSTQTKEEREVNRRKETSNTIAIE